MSKDLDLKKIFQQAEEAMCLVDPDGRFLMVNQAFTKLLGYTDKAIRGRLFSEIVHRSTKVKQITSHSRLYHFFCSEKRPTEMMLISSHGADVPIRMRSTILRDESGQANEAIGTLVSAFQEEGEKSIDQKTWESQQDFDTLLMNSGDAIIVCDISGTIINFNDPLLQMLGYDESELLGRHLIELSPFDGSYLTSTGEQVSIGDAYVNYQVEMACEMLGKGKVTGYQLYLIRKDQVLVPVEATISMLKDREGERRGSIAICRDITERRRVENEIKRIKAAVDSAGDAIGMSTPEGRHFYQNEAFDRMFGYTLEEVSRMHPATLYENQDIAKQVFETIMAGESWHGEIEMVAKNGRRFPVLLRADAIKDANKNVTGLFGVHTDITERKQAEEVLRENEERYRSVVETATDAIITINRHGVVTFWNDAAQQMYGYSRDEIVGSSVATIMPERLRLAHMQLLEKIMSFDGQMPTKQRTQEGLGLRKNGEEFYAEVAGAPWKSGPEVFYTLFIRDITERWQAAEALRESEEKLRRIIENSVDGIYLFDENGLIVEWNKGVEQITMLPREQALGRPLWDVYYEFLPDEVKNPGILEALKGSILESLRTGSRPRTMLELVVQRPDKTRRVVQSSDFPIRTTRGNMRCVITRDITERHLAEEERSKLIAAIEQAQEAIMISDKDGFIQYINTSFEHMLGYSKVEVMGMNQAAFPRVHDSFRIHQKAWDSIKQGNVWTGIINASNKKGTKIQLEVVISPIRNAQGVVTSFVSIARDITKERMMEEHLRKSQKMEAIGTLAGGIAHDFNNILAAIMGYAELAERNLPEGSTMEYNLSQVLNAADRARDLVKQILAFSRKADQERQPVMLKSIIKEALKLLRATIPTTIEIVSSVNNDSGYVNADPTQMHQVLINLCTNAAYAMQERGGTLEVGLVPIALSEADMAMFPDLQPGKYVKLTVRDTGTGIDPEIIERIFDPFFTTKEVGKGTGMGLAVVHGIVKSHGGAISVESRPGAGTSFTILLPRAAEKTAVEKTPAAMLPTGTEYILFVDDEASLVQISCEMLSSLGYQVTGEQSSLEALALFQKDPARFDLVITDQTMPQMTGVALAHELQKIRPEIPIILCTGFSEAVDAAKVHGLNIRAFLLKPIKLKEMAETIRKVLEKHEA